MARAHQRWRAQFSAHAKILAIKALQTYESLLLA
jgi:hypothetical protein